MLVDGIDDFVLDGNDVYVCTARIKRKMTRVKFDRKSDSPRADEIGNIAGDLKGPVKPTVLGGFKYAYCWKEIATRYS